MEHAHHHGHPHRLDLRRADSRRRMRIALGLNVLMLAVGLIGGIVTGSLAVLADAGHVLSDVAAIALGLLAVSLAARPSGPRRTFGLQRSEVLAAFANGLALVVVATLVVIAALGRLSDPPELEGSAVLLLGLAGLLGNAAATWVMARGDRDDLNLRAVMRHSFADALGSLAVLASGAVILATGWLQADPLASLVVAALILASSVRLVLEPLDVLMESAPAGLDVDSLGSELCAIDSVREIHELHVWTVTAGFETLSAHVVVARGSDRDAVRRRLEFVLADRFGIEHTTLQMEDEVDRGELLQVRLQGP